MTSIVGPAIILACSLTLLVAPRIAAREDRSWIRELALALLLGLALVATNGVLAFAAVAAMALVIGVGALPASRTAAVTLALSAAAGLGAAVALAMGHPQAAFIASVVALALRTGVFPLHGGVASLTDRNLSLQLQQIATLPVMVMVHLRFVSQEPWAVDLAPYIVAAGTASTLGFALVALAQRNLRGLLHASMLMHGGMLFAAVGAAGHGHHAAAMFVAVTFGLALSGFAIMVASFEARVGRLTQPGPGGRARAFPRLAAALAIFGAAAVGLPGTAGFAADDLLLHALWQESAASTVVMIVASAILAVATLAGFARAFLGRPVQQLAPDLLGRERFVAVGLVAWLVVLGFAPGVLAAPIAVMLP